MKLTSGLLGYVKDAIIIGTALIGIAFAWAKLATESYVQAAVIEVKQEHKAQIDDLKGWMVRIDSRLYEMQKGNK